LNELYAVGCELEGIGAWKLAAGFGLVGLVGLVGELLMEGVGLVGCVFVVAGVGAVLPDAGWESGDALAVGVIAAVGEEAGVGLAVGCVSELGVVVTLAVASELAAVVVSALCANAEYKGVIVTAATRKRAAQLIAA
jgi:hypothetical protein